VATTPNERPDAPDGDPVDVEAPTEAAVHAASPPAPTPSDKLAEGTVLDDKLRISQVLGRGAVGVVYLADHIQLERRVALKLTHADGDISAERLVAAARAMAAITHENVVTVYDVGAIGDQVFIAMEYLDGGTARSWLRGQQRTWREISKLYLAAGRGLAAAHARGLVHRDFKPDNVLLSKAGKVCVADFGLARAATYMPPEQFHGTAASERSDQFAFCVSLYEALCGFRPFPNASLAQMRDPNANRLPPDTPETTRLPKHVRRALWRGLSTDPDERFASMDGLLRELSRNPAASVRRFGVASIALGATAGVTYVVADREQDRCDGAQQRLAGVWDAPTETKLERAFAATEISYADEAWEHASSLLAAYANAWAAAHRETCEATHTRGSQSAELMDLRMACLDERLDSLSTTIEVLAEPDADVVHNAFAAASELPRLETCSDTETLREIGAIPEHQLEVARRVRHRINVARANLTTGQVDTAAEASAQALEQAEAAGLPILRAHAHHIVADVAVAKREWAPAADGLRAAMDAAIVAKDDATVVDALIELLYVEGYELGRPDAARWAEQANAWTERMANPPHTRAALLNYEGLIARDAAQFDKALGAFEQALELLGDNPTEALRTRGMLADAYRRMGDLESAAALFDENLRATETAVGAEHPLFAAELDSSATVFMQMGRLDEAQTRYERALEIRTAAFGDDSLDVAESLFDVGVVMARQNDFATARKHLEDAWGIMQDRAEPDRRVLLLGELGEAAHQLGEPEKASQWFERALELGDKELGPAAPAVLEQRIHLAEMLADGGDLERAEEVVARAMEDLRAAEVEDAPHKQQLYALRGDLRLRAKKPAGALEDLRLTLELLDKLQFVDQRARLGPLRGAGEALLELGKPTEAIKYLVEAKQGAPEGGGDGRVELALARARVATGDSEAAHASAVLAKRLLDPEDTEYVALADALIAQTQPQ